MAIDLAILDLVEHTAESWLDPQHGPKLAADLRRRIIERVGTRPHLLITLTYHRAQFDDPLDLYRTQAEQRHVREFIRRLGDWLIKEHPHLADRGNPLTGRWLRKMEFQSETGEDWPHFHILLDWRGFIPSHIVTELWGHGFADVQRVKGEECAYVAKYVAKSGECPAWLLMERPRSVRIVSVSPGFWTRPVGRAADAQASRPACCPGCGFRLRGSRPCHCGCDEAGGLDQCQQSDGACVPRRGIRSPRRHGEGAVAYVPIGYRLNRPSTRVVVHDAAGRYKRTCRVAGPVGRLLGAFSRWYRCPDGDRVVGLRVRIPAGEVESVLEPMRSDFGGVVARRGMRHGPAGREAAAGPAFDLIHTGDPRQTPLSVMNRDPILQAYWVSQGVMWYTRCGEERGAD